MIRSFHSSAGRFRRVRPGRAGTTGKWTVGNGRSSRLDREEGAGDPEAVILGARRVSGRGVGSATIAESSGLVGSGRLAVPRWLLVHKCPLLDVSEGAEKTGR